MPPRKSTTKPDPEPETPALELPAGLRLREPSGVAAFPVILVEGEEKGGKTFAGCALSASEKVGRTFAFDLAGDGTLDEYRNLGPYQIVETNGTFGDFLQQLKLAASVPSVDGKPNVLDLDSMTSLWTIICDWLDDRARNRPKNRAALEANPDAEVQITSDLWNEGKDRWRDVMNVLMRYPGIVVMTARGKEVAVMDSNGQPTKDKTWKVEAEKTLTWDATAWVRVTRGAPPRLMAARSLALDVPDAGMILPRTMTLENLVFDVLGAGVEFGVRQTSAPQYGIPVKDAKRRLLGFLAAQGVTEDLARQQATAVWRAAGLDGRGAITEADFSNVLHLVAQRHEASTIPKADAETTEGEPEPATTPEPIPTADPGADETCAGCGQPIEDGDEIWYDPEGLAYHHEHRLPDAEREPVSG